MKNARQRIKDKNRTLRREVKRESDIYERERESGEWRVGRCENGGAARERGVKGNR